MLKSISGQLCTHVSLQLAEGMSYAELRECLLKWDRAQQRWGHLIPSSHDDAPMEVDRVQERGKGKKGKGGKGGGKQDKGKGKDKGKSKGKDCFQAKGKGKKSDGKGKNNWSYDEGKNNWSYDKGKGQSQQSQSDVKCFRCNGRGHYAKDCTVRMMAEDGGQGQEAPQASPSSRTSGAASHATSSTQLRVARIQDATSSTHIQEQASASSAPMVIDMRCGSLAEVDELRVIHY